MSYEYEIGDVSMENVEKEIDAYELEEAKIQEQEEKEIKDAKDEITTNDLICYSLIKRFGADLFIPVFRDYRHGLKQLRLIDPKATSKLLNLQNPLVFESLIEFNLLALVQAIRIKNPNIVGIGLTLYKKENQFCLFYHGYYCSDLMIDAKIRLENEAILLTKTRLKASLERFEYKRYWAWSWQKILIQLLDKRIRLLQLNLHALKIRNIEKFIDRR